MKRGLILVVEDNEFQWRILADALTKDYIVFLARNGVEAIEHIEELRDKISLIIMDLEMPVLDGYGVLEHITSSMEEINIPILITSSNQLDIEKAKNSMKLLKGYLRKPYTAAEIIKRAEEILSEK